MAKYILWFAAILAFVTITAEYKNGEDIQLFTKVLFWSILSILAICESIEKSKRN